MDGTPAGVDSFDQTVVFLVGDDLCRMPSGAPVKHVEDDMFVHKQEVTLNLLVKGVWHIDTA